MGVTIDKILGNPLLHKHNASDVTIDSTSFDNNLSTSDDDLQTAMTTIDNMAIDIDGGTFFDTYGTTNNIDAGTF